MEMGISRSFYDQVETLQRCSDVAEVMSVCQEFLSFYRGKYFKYSWTPPAIVSRSSQICFFTCPEPWLDHYLDKGYEVTDPKVRYCSNYQNPVEWNADIIGNKLINNNIEDEDISFWQYTLDMGLGNGVTIPIRGIAGSTGMLCIAYDGEHTASDITSLPLFEAWAMYIQNQIEKLYVEQQIRIPLSSREKEVLKWTVIGKTAENIAEILNISSNTVLFHLRNLREKLNVSNKHHLIARAISLNLVSL